MKDDFQIFELDDIDFEDQIIADTEEAILEEGYEDHYLEEGVEYEEAYTEDEYTEDEYVEGYYEEQEVSDGGTLEYYETEPYDEQVEYEEVEEYEENVEYEEAEEYYEADEYEAEEEYYEAEEYEEDGVYYEAEEYEDEYEDDDLAYETLEVKQVKKPRNSHKKEGLGAKIKSFFQGAHAMDFIIAATGVLVVTVGIVTAVAWKSADSVKDQVEAMATVGETLGSVSVVGEGKLLAVKDAYVAMINSVPTEEEENKENIQVTVNFTSIEKDLKIKFLNKETGELVTGVLFQVELTDSKDQTTTLTDDNKDGIIYETKMKAGSYKVVCQNVGGFTFPQSGTSVKVKDKVEYQKIDIADEVKKESQVNVAVEDTKKEEKVEEVKLQDTVEWVESTKTAVNADSNYTAVDKAKIPDPSTLGRAFGSFLLMATEDVTISGISTNPKVGETGTLTAAFSSGTVATKLAWSSSNESVATVDSNGKYSIVGEGKTTIRVDAEGKKDTFSDDNITVNGSEVVTGTKSIEINVATTIKDEVTAIALTAAPTDVTQGGTTTFSATLTVTGSPSEKVLWTIEGGATLSATTTKSGESVTITVNKDATVDSTIKVTASAEAKTSITNSKSFKVKAAPIETHISGVKITPDKLDLPSGTAKKLEATVTVAGTGTIDKGVTWTIAEADKAYLTLAADGTVTALPGGVGKTVTVTATTKGNGVDGKTPLKAESKITITKATATITLDKTTISLPQGKEDTIKATVANLADTRVTWKSDNEKIVTVDANGKIKGIAIGTANVTATTAGKEVSAACKVTVVKSTQGDTTTKLKDKDGNQVYVKEDGKFREAVYADFYKFSEFFIKGQEQYRYTGWQTLDNKTYYFNKNGDKVTGEQVIQGVKYNFAGDGALSMGNGAMGIDVSRYNGTINWQAVKNSGVSYAIIRCGYRGYSSGVLVEDSKFKANIQGAKAAGLKVGVYFVTQAVNEVEAVQEASMVLDLVKPYGLSYPVFIDIERSGGRGDNIDRGTRTAVANAFCQTIKNNGYGAGIYANKDWFENKMNAGQLSSHKIWLAQYSSKPTYKGRYDIWQYTSKGTIGGINGHVDLNTSYF